MSSLADLEKDPDFLALTNENKIKVLQGIKEQLTATRPSDLGQAMAQVQQQQAQADAELEAETPDLSLPSVPQGGQSAAVQAIGDRAIADLNRAAPVQPQGPDLMQGLGNVANAGLGLIQQIPGAFQKEAESLKGNPLGLQEMQAAALTGMASTPTDLINLITQAPAAIGNAYLGRQQYKPLLPEVYGARDIPLLKEITERHPVSDFIGGAAVPVDLGIGALTKGRKVAPVANSVDFATPKHGFVDLHGRPISRSDYEPSDVNITPNVANLSTTQEVADLNRAFKDRTVGSPEIIDPRKADIPQDLGQVKTETTDSGLQVVTKAGQRDIPDLSIARDPFYRPEPATRVYTAPAPSKSTSLGEVIQDSLSKNYGEQDKLIAADTLESMGYDVREITKKNNTQATGKQYSVTIGDKTIRFEEGQTLSGLMAEHEIGSDTIARGVNARGGKFNQERLLEMLPESEAKQRFLGGQGQRAYNEHAAAEDQYYAKAEAEANALINRIDQAESPEHLSELAKEAMDPKYQNSPAYEDIFNKLDEVERRLTGDPSAPLPTSRDLALRRADDLSQPKDPADVQPAKPLRSADNAANDLAVSPPRDLGSTPKLLDSQGRPFGEKPAVPDLGTTKPAAELVTPTGRPLDLASPVKVLDEAPAPKTSGNVQTAPGGGQVYTQGRDAAAVEKLAQALEKNNQILALEDAKKLLADKKAAGLLSPEDVQKQTDVLNLFEEAGRNGKTFDVMRREIQEGEGRISAELGKDEVKTREALSPFAITVRQRKPQTEVSNLVKRLGSAEAARDELRQVAKRYGITPTTAGKTVNANARKIAEQIANHPKGRLEFTDIYLNAHNFKTGGERTLTDAPRGYPLRTIESANIGTEAAAIPQGALNQNAIAQQFSALEEIKTAPDISPELKTLVTKVTDNPNVSFKDIRKMRQLIGQSLERFCSIWGLK